jgi:predicted amidophosphoribosyltransferase
MHNERPTTITMRCVACGHALDGIRSLECPECGRPFDPRDPDTYTRSLEKPTRLLTAASVEEAESIADILEGGGLPVAIEYAARGIVEQAKASIWVNAWDTERARTILQQHASAHSPAGATWVCPSCSERIEPQFRECWNCQTPRPHDT